MTVLTWSSAPQIPPSTLMVSRKHEVPSPFLPSVLEGKKTGTRDDKKMKFKTSVTSSSQTGAHQGKHGGDHMAGSHFHFCDGGPLQSRQPLVFQVEGELGKSEVALKSLSVTVKLSIKINKFH